MRRGRLPKEKARRFYNSTVRLLRYTTWKCGRIERAIVNYLRVKLSRSGEAKATVKEILQASPVRKEALYALRRLQARRSIKIGGLEVESG
jgi:hypothetical protein